MKDQVPTNNPAGRLYHVLYDCRRSATTQKTLKVRLAEVLDVPVDTPEFHRAYASLIDLPNRTRVSFNSLENVGYKNFYLTHVTKYRSCSPKRESTR